MIAQACIVKPVRIATRLGITRRGAARAGAARGADRHEHHLPHVPRQLGRQGRQERQAAAVARGHRHAADDAGHSLLAPASRAPPDHGTRLVRPGRLRHADTRFARPGLRPGRPGAPRPGASTGRRRRLLPHRRAAHPGTALRRLPWLLRRTLPAQARRLGGHRARRQQAARLRRHACARRRSDTPVRGCAAAFAVARQGLPPGIERARAHGAGEPGGQRAAPCAGAEAEASLARRPGAGQGIRCLAGPLQQLPQHRGVRRLRAQVAAGRHALRPARLDGPRNGHRHALAGRRRAL